MATNPVLYDNKVNHPSMGTCSVMRGEKTTSVENFSTENLPTWLAPHTDLPVGIGIGIRPKETIPSTDRYAHYKERVNSLIDEYTSGETVPTVYRDLVRYSLSDGKRVRAVIALSMIDHFFGMYGCREGTPVSGDGEVANIVIDRKTRTAIEMACLGVEILHAASLIIDDLPCMDNAATRRGKPTMHCRYGEAAAILTAGHLMTSCVSLYTTAYLHLQMLGIGCAENVLSLCGKISEYMGFNGACGGQLMDLGRARVGMDDFSSHPRNEPGQIGIGGEGGGGGELERDTKELMSKKTSSFFRVAFLTGIMMMKNEPILKEHENILIKVSEFTGLAFQIYDDFEDILEDGNKHNYVSAMGVEEAYSKFQYVTSKSKTLLQMIDLYPNVYGDIVEFMDSGIILKMRDLRPNQLLQVSWK